MPSGHYIYRQFNFQQFYSLPTQCNYVFCVDLKTNSDYFPIQHFNPLTPNDDSSGRTAPLVSNRVGECLLRGTVLVFSYMYLSLYIYRHIKTSLPQF